MHWSRRRDGRAARCSRKLTRLHAGLKTLDDPRHFLLAGVRHDDSRHFLLTGARHDDPVNLSVLVHLDAPFPMSVVAPPRVGRALTLSLAAGRDSIAFRDLSSTVMRKSRRAVSRPWTAEV